MRASRFGSRHAEVVPRAPALHPTMDRLAMSFPGLVRVRAVRGYELRNVQSFGKP